MARPALTAGTARRAANRRVVSRGQAARRTSRQLTPPTRTHRPAEDREDALELALLLAEEDAAVHDYRQAQQAIDAAAALMGGVLPSGWAERHRRWEAALREREATVA